MPLKLEGLSVLQRKLIIDLMRKKHPELWTRFKQNGFSWTHSRRILEQFIKQNSREVLRELRKTCPLSYGWRTLNG